MVWYGTNLEGKGMGLRFRRRIKILPGLWLNLSKSGMSTSIGGKGLTVNLKGDKVKTTVGLPGTGLSYSETSTATPKPRDAQTPRRATPSWVWLVIIVVAVLVVMAR